MNNLPEWNLADRLRKIRRDRRLTQEQMAEVIGTKAVTLAAWEEGRNRPKDVVELAQTIEREFGVPAAWTLGVLQGRRSTDLPQQERARLTDAQFQQLARNWLPERARIA